MWRGLLARFVGKVRRCKDLGNAPGSDCETVGPQLTNNTAHSVTRYDRMIMLGPLGPSDRACVSWSFLAPRAGAVAAFVRPQSGTAPVGMAPCNCRPAAPKPGQHPAKGNCGSWRQLASEWPVIVALRYP